MTTNNRMGYLAALLVIAALIGGFSTFEGVPTSEEQTVKGLTVTDLTASRPVAASAAKALESTTAATWIAGTASEVTVADDGDGSVTIGIDDPLALTKGGSAKSLTASNGGLIYSDGDSMEVLAGTATAGQIPRSGSSAAPSWSTATFASTYGASQLLYSNGANTVQGLTTGNSGLLVTDGAGVPSIGTDIPTAVTIGTAYIYRAGGTDVAQADGGFGGDLSAATNGQLMIGNTGTGMVLATLTGTANQIGVTNAAGSITLNLLGDTNADYVWTSGGDGTASWQAASSGWTGTATSDLDMDGYAIKDTDDGNVVIDDSLTVSATLQDTVTDATTNGTTTISKAGENFSTTCAVGDVVLIYGGTTTADYGLYLVTTVTDNTHLVLSRAATGSDADVDFYVFRNGTMVTGNRIALMGDVYTDRFRGQKQNTVFGVSSGKSGMTGNENALFGYNTGASLTSGGYNTLVGAAAGQLITSANYNTCVGRYTCGQLTTAGSNTAVGPNALNAGGNSANRTGVGMSAGRSSGAGTTTVGVNSAYFQNNGSTELTGYTNGVYIGYDSRGNANSEDNAIVIGYQALGQGSNTTVIGNTSTVSTWIGGALIVSDVDVTCNDDGDTCAYTSGTAQHWITAGTDAAGDTMTVEACAAATSGKTQTFTQVGGTDDILIDVPTGTDSTLADTGDSVTYRCSATDTTWYAIASNGL